MYGLRVLRALTMGSLLLATACGGPASDAPPVAAPPATSSVASVPAPPETTLGAGGLPTARDGTNYAACDTRACQVQVTNGTRLTAMGIRLKLRVGPRNVTFTTDGYSGTTQVSGGPGNRNTIGINGRSVTARVLAVQGDQAVVAFS